MRVKQRAEVRYRDEVAVQLPGVDLVRVARWCDEKVPEFARNQVRMEYRVRAATVTRGRTAGALERRGHPVWRRLDGAAGRTAALCAGSMALWWPDGNTRWHLVDDVLASASVVPLLEALDDPRRALLG